MTMTTPTYQYTRREERTTKKPNSKTAHTAIQTQQVIIDY